MGPYRVRLLQFPVVLYQGQSFRTAVVVFDEQKLMDRILERLVGDTWQSVMSVERGNPETGEPHGRE